MKKYDELLKRVEMFEKLAVYGNRGEFLKSIAQPAPSFQSHDPNAPNYMDAKYLKNPTLPDLSTVPQWQKDWSSAPEAPHDAAEQAYWDEKSKGTHPLTGTPGATTSPANTQKRNSVGIPYRSDVYTAQQRLRSSPYSFQDLEIDGKLGPITRAHLKSYRQQVGAPANQTDEQSIAALNGEAYNELSTLATPPAAVPSTWSTSVTNRDHNVIT